jgi:hypothetical protein
MGDVGLVACVAGCMTRALQHAMHAASNLDTVSHRFTWRTNPAEAPVASTHNKTQHSTTQHVNEFT